MTFYGLPTEDIEKVRDLMGEIMALYEKHDQKIIGGDNMLLAMRSTSFLADPGFGDAIGAYCFDNAGKELPNNMTKYWRLHVYTWCCRQALRMAGDMVECGVHMGLYSLVMMKAVDFATSDKQMYLYDTFEGLSVENSSENERYLVQGVYDIPDWEKTVRKSFAHYPNANIVKGIVPDVLHDTAPESVCFIHIDMNAAEAEVAALDFFQARFVPGAIILLDDFGRTENQELCLAHTKWFTKRGRSILEMPTGQGMVIWN